MPAVDTPETCGAMRFRFVITTPDSPWSVSFDEEFADESAAQGRAQTMLDQLALVYGAVGMVKIVVEADRVGSMRNI